MSPTLRSIREELQRLKLEVSPRVHLAGAGTRAHWAELEADLERFEQKAELAHDRVGDHFVEEGMDLLARLRELRSHVRHDLEEPVTSDA